MQKLYLKSSSSKDYENWVSLLEKEGIKEENAIQDTFGIYEGGRLIATASRFQNIIKCVAIDSSYQGTSVFNELITHLCNEVVSAGFHSCYVYTKESAKKAFTYVGFKELEQVGNKLCFMENAASGFDSYLNNLSKQRVCGESIAAIVMNANPFTKGHLFLVTKASEENDAIHLFVLSEDMSVFSAKDRIELAGKATAHLNNVYIHETGSYMVSAATFPSYFLEEDADITEIQASLDARLFKNHIAKALGIHIRYVGSEPFSVATNMYNDAMKKEFEGHIDLKVIERISAGGEIVSASKVRMLLETGDIKSACDLVPPTTCEFFRLDKGLQVMEKLKRNHEKKQKPNEY